MDLWEPHSDSAESYAWLTAVPWTLSRFRSYLGGGVIHLYVLHKLSSPNPLV